MANANYKISRIKSKNKVLFETLGSVVAPEVLHSRVPRLADAAEGRAELQNLHSEIQQWGKYTRASNMIGEGALQYVANIDQSVWSVILDLFARFDDETGEPMDDGLLYITDARGNVVLNRDFFYALVEHLQASGYNCDMRGKIKLT